MRLDNPELRRWAKLNYLDIVWLMHVDPYMLSQNDMYVRYQGVMHRILSITTPDGWYATFWLVMECTKTGIMCQDQFDEYDIVYYRNS